MSYSRFRPFRRDSRNPKRSHRSHVHLEQLESRQLLATVTWNNPEGGSWNNASNWSWSPTGAGLPGPGDDVVINDLNAGDTVTIGSGNQAINSITATNPLVISGGTLTLAADSSITTLTENGGAVVGSGTLTITQDFDWTGGELDGAGTIAIAKGASMSISGSNTLLMRDSPVLANDGTIVWSATGMLQAIGQGSVFDNAGVFNVESNATFLSVALHNSGTVNVQSGIFSPNAGGATALDSGEFDVTSGAELQLGLGDFELNSGTQMLGSGLYELDQGTVTVDTDASVPNLTMTGGDMNGPGTLTVTNSFSWTGGELDGASTTAIAQGATMTLSGSNTLLMRDGHVLVNDGTVVWSATGVLQAAGADAVFDNEGAFNVESNAAFENVILNSSGTVNVQSGTLTANAGSGTQLESGVFDVASGAELLFASSVDGDGEGDVELNAGTQLLGSGLYELDLGFVTVDSEVSVPNLTITGGVLNGPNTLTVTNSFNWKGGELDNAGTTAIAQGATMSLTGSKNLLMRNGHVLANDGTVVWSATGMLQSDKGAVFDNEGVFNVESNATFASVALNNSGTVNVQSGSLAVNAQSATQVESGTFQVDSGAVLHFANSFDSVSQGNVELNSGTQLLGSGLYEIDAGTVTVATSESVANLTMTNGTLTGPGTLTVTNAFNYTGGDLDGADTLVIASTGTMTPLAAKVDLTNGFTLDNLGTIDWSGSGQVTGLIKNAGTVDIASGTMTLAGGALGAGGNFEVAQGAVLDLDGGAFTGTLTSSGSGTVALDVGTITIGIGGATFDFPGDMFQWTGGFISGSDGGTLTNEGVINLAGSSGKTLSNDATLDNFGTIYQSGSGNLSLHGDDQAPSVLKIEAGASYLIESDSGVDNYYGGETEIDNAGTIEKTAGTGTSTILVNGTLNNIGTIESDSGTLSLSATIAQLSQGTLTSGTWNALDGATLAFPNGTDITANQATICLDGAGAAIVGLNGPASNSGSLSITSGADLSTTGDLSNSGSATVGAGSTLTVSGTYTQASSGSLTIGLGGVSAGNNYGELAITGSAALAGSISATAASGFAPSAGQSFPIITYASETGADGVNFAGINTSALSVLQPVIGKKGIALSTVSSPANLVVQTFNVAANATAGQNLSVTYQVDNVSANGFTGTWTDSVYLSPQTTLTANSVLLGRVQQNGVAANGEYSQTVQAAVPGVLPGNYYAIVLADSQGLAPELNRTNTELASSNPVQITVQPLTLSSPLSGTHRQRPKHIQTAHRSRWPRHRHFRRARSPARRRALRRLPPPEHPDHPHI